MIKFTVPLTLFLGVLLIGLVSLPANEISAADCVCPESCSKPCNYYCPPGQSTCPNPAYYECEQYDDYSGGDLVNPGGQGRWASYGDCGMALDGDFENHPGETYPPCNLYNAECYIDPGEWIHRSDADGCFVPEE